MGPQICRPGIVFLNALQTPWLWQPIRILMLCRFVIPRVARKTQITDAWTAEQARFICNATPNDNSHVCFPRISLLNRIPELFTKNMEIVLCQPDEWHKSARGETYKMYSLWLKCWLSNLTHLEVVLEMEKESYITFNYHMNAAPPLKSARWVNCYLVAY